MFIKFLFKKNNISHKKMRYTINRIRGFSLINMLIYLSFIKNKSSFILKKIILSCLTSFKNKSLNFLNFNIIKISSEKGIIFKRPFYRSRGRFNFIKKKYCNIIIIFSNF